MFITPSAVSAATTEEIRFREEPQAKAALFRLRVLQKRGRFLFARSRTQPAPNVRIALTFHTGPLTSVSLAECGNRR